MNKIKAGFFSFGELSGDHTPYVEWHQLDHMPEQFRIQGLSWGQRWVATPACRAARSADEEPLRRVQYVTLYLMEDPVERVLREFFALAHELRGLGRFRTDTTGHLTGAFQLLETHAAPRILISPEAVPYRPNRGVYAIAEATTDRERLGEWVRWLHREHADELLRVPGVAGIWSFAATGAYGTPRENVADRITILYLDDEPLAVAAALEPLVKERRRDAPVRQLLAGPFESLTPPARWDHYHHAQNQAPDER